MSMIDDLLQICTFRVSDNNLSTSVEFNRASRLGSVTGFGHHGIFKRNRINLNICKKWRTKLDPNFLNTQVPILVNYFIQIIEEKYENSRLNRDTRETRGTREAKQSKEKRENKETRELKPKDILELLPCVERLRAAEGSVISGGRSEAGENISDRESVNSGVVTRNLRNKGRKATKVSRGNIKKVGLSTRSSKGRGRRSVAKKKPIKSLNTVPTPVTSDKIYYKGEFFMVGDIVSVTDISDDIFYAQLRGFLTDEYGEKSGVISWLLPTTGSPPPNEGFHPATYIIGPEEDIPRRMEVFSFVMRAPSDYFYNRHSPYRTATLPGTSKNGFTSLRLGPRIVRTNDNKTVYVGI
ncbi:GATA zinc finger domain-containing protein 1 [Eurytemora carolleeae]|uniref:GATA zinc finger domain-containing protein 1 n=1 Tax=Eurytemora carolleeae TaxID=1294199 RepID=UPI000C780D7C|nr:GATA zinc finger domain-containing protein 1 [Eurytemora carolleeae]|eukprot:XP_023327091.1 GATA zinc finger domain-containing protein 1-like [Eurytemora affinis]